MLERKLRDPIATRASKVKRLLRPASSGATGGEFPLNKNKAEKRKKNMKTYTMTINEEQAEAIGYALMQTISREKHTMSQRSGNIAAEKDLINRLQSAYLSLDSAQEVLS